MPELCLKVTPEWAPSSGGEQELVRLLCRSTLTGASAGGLDQLARRADWELVFRIVRENRLVTAFEQGAVANGVEIPSEVRARLQSIRSMIMVMNALGLSVIRRIVPELEQKNVRAVVLKGPLEQMRVYGTYFARLSTDVDILVRREQFAAAQQVLMSLGYDLSAKFRSLWWRNFLGEQHFASRFNQVSVVDLHWQLQQPGCPQPTDLDRFASDPATVMIGTTPVPVLSDTRAVLLSCMSLAKAHLHRDAVGANALDVAISLGTADEGRRAAILAEARSMALENTVLFASRVASRLFGVRIDFPSLPIPPRLERQICDMSLRPELPGLEWPMRRQLLWLLSDGEKVRRLTLFSREMVRSMASDLVRRASTPSRRPSPIDR